jgi:hypothetical protein
MADFPWRFSPAEIRFAAKAKEDIALRGRSRWIT